MVLFANAARFFLKKRLESTYWIQARMNKKQLYFPV